MRFLALVLVMLLSAIALDAEPIATPVRITSLDEVYSRLATCRNATLSAYTLERGSPIVNALITAASRGCRVNVILDGRAFGFARRANEEVSPDLQGHGVRVITSVTPLHLKAAIIDGHTVLSDRNWASSGDSLVIGDDDPLDYRLIYAGLVCSYQTTSACPPRGNNHLWVVKSQALAAEAAVIRSGQSHNIAVESESWGPGTPVYDSVREMAERGMHVRVLVASLEYRQSKSQTERRSLQELSDLGVLVRVGPASEKIAINGSCVFDGSTNTTRGLASQIDWGIALCNEDFARQIASHFERNWAEATPIE
jgi:hypothetical protein